MLTSWTSSRFSHDCHAIHKVRDVLDVTCGSGRHVLGLAHRGYKCVGQDYTPEQVQIAKSRARRKGVAVKLLQGDATRLKYESEFEGATVEQCSQVHLVFSANPRFYGWE